MEMKGEIRYYLKSKIVILEFVFLLTNNFSFTKLMTKISKPIPIHPKYIIKMRILSNSPQFYFVVNPKI